MKSKLTILSGSIIVIILVVLLSFTDTDLKPKEVEAKRKRTHLRSQQKMAQASSIASPLTAGDGSPSEFTVTFRDDLTLEIEPVSSNTVLEFCEQEINYMKMLRDPESCGKFIGVELVDGGGADLTSIPGNMFSGGVYYNRDHSSLLSNHIPGLDKSAGVTKSKISKVSITLENLISRLKPTLGTPTLRGAILREGLRFRIQCDLPSSEGKWMKVKSEWVTVSASARQNLFLYLDPDNNL